MGTLEIIQVRLAHRPQDSVIEEIRSSIAAGKCPLEIRIYRSVSVPTDFAVHLIAPREEACASDLGLRIAAALKDHGLIDHTVWIEETGPKPSPVD